MITDYFHKLISTHKSGTPAGIFAVCSANFFVIRAALEHARQVNQPALIESTGHQVNQYRGYTGFTPALFARFIRQSALSAGLDAHQILLGTDHLGTGPWQAETADVAMKKACDLVRQCVLAGYRKLHLDPSMPCRDDIPQHPSGFSPRLPVETIARRTALLCKTAETASAECSDQMHDLIYVVGAEVPVPGGLAAGDMAANDNGACVSSAEDVQKTLHAMARAFARGNLENAWERCVAVVAETGATFSADAIHPYERNRTRNLQALIRRHPNLVFEAHSTDFQTQSALAAMVQDHFAILKTGPCLTFAAREALFALAAIEADVLGCRKTVTLSQLPAVMRNVMFKDPVHWKHHYTGSHEYLHHITLYGFSDRIRYYWSRPESRAAVARLFDNLNRYGIPLPLVSQYLPDLADGVKTGRVSPTPERLVTEKITKVLKIYNAACGKSKK